MTGKTPARPGIMTPHGQTVIPKGDYGLGLCLACIGERIIGNPVLTEFAVTLCPMMWPPSAPIGMVAVPTCYKHTEDAAKAAMGLASGLVVANGGLPK